MARPKLGRPVYRLRRRANGIFTLSWTDPGTSKTVALSTGQSDQSQAEIWRDQFLAGLDQPAPPPPQPRISQILDGYLAARKPHVAAYDTLEWAAQGLRRHVGNLEPHMLTPPMYRDRREAEGVGDGTMRREIGVLRAALAWATKQQPPWIDRAPFIESPPSPPPRERWLTRKEIDALVAGAGSTHMWLFVLLAYHTAARTGAILELTWDRVDLEHRRIDYRRPGRATTNKRRATVPINATLLSALRTVHTLSLESAEKQRREVAVHVIEWHGKPLASVKRGFAAACERAGIEDCSPHVLRHTAATHMVMAGVPLAEVARMLGDREEVVERVYGKHSPDYLKRAADALAGDLSPRIISRTPVRD